MTPKQKVILFLISFDGFNDTYQLVKLLDRADFPSELSKHLELLLDQELIYVSGLANNGTPFKYGVTEKGKTIILEKDFRAEVISCIKTMQNPDFLLQITEKLIARENG